MQRVVILGPGGAGKSTLARRLGERAGLPVIHLDEHFWRPGWVETPREEWRLTQRALLAGDQWIVDGNYSATLDERAPRADTIVLLDFPWWRALPRALRRSVRNYGRDVQAPDCPERLDPKFLWWVVRYRWRSRPNVLRLVSELAPAADLHVLRSSRAVEAFLRTVP